MIFLMGVCYFLQQLWRLLVNKRIPNTSLILASVFLQTQNFEQASDDTNDTNEFLASSPPPKAYARKRKTTTPGCNPYISLQ